MARAHEPVYRLELLPEHPISALAFVLSHFDELERYGGAVAMLELAVLAWRCLQGYGLPNSQLLLQPNPNHQVHT